MHDRTEHTPTAVMQRSDCPDWCAGAHLRDARADFHHQRSVDLVQLPDLLGRDGGILEVGVSLFSSDELGAGPNDECIPMVEVRGLENSGCVDLGRLTAQEARRLAGWLLEAASIAEPLSTSDVTDELHAMRTRMDRLEQLMTERG